MMSLIRIDQDIEVDLPDLDSFSREAWAYQYLPDGLLRKLLFGRSASFVTELTRLGNQPMSEELLKNYIKFYGLHKAIGELILNYGIGKPANKVKEWYESLENRLYANYCDQHDDLKFQ